MLAHRQRRLSLNACREKRVSILLVIFFAVFVWSAFRPHDYFTWFLEVVPAIIGLAVLAPTYMRFRFTTGVYCIILLHAIVLLVGGHYTYAQVPVGNWFRDHFHLAGLHPGAGLARGTSAQSHCSPRQCAARRMAVVHRLCNFNDDHCPVRVV